MQKDVSGVGKMCHEDFRACRPLIRSCMLFPLKTAQLSITIIGDRRKLRCAGTVRMHALVPDFIGMHSRALGEFEIGDRRKLFRDAQKLVREAMIAF